MSRVEAQRRRRSPMRPTSPKSRPSRALETVWFNPSSIADLLRQCRRGLPPTSTYRRQPSLRCTTSILSVKIAQRLVLRERAFALLPPRIVPSHQPRRKGTGALPKAAVPFAWPGYGHGSSHARRARRDQSAFAHRFRDCLCSALLRVLPGETIAALEEMDISTTRFQRDPHQPYCSYVVVD